MLPARSTALRRRITNTACGENGKGRVRPLATRRHTVNVQCAARLERQQQLLVGHAGGFGPRQHQPQQWQREQQQRQQQQLRCR